MSDARTVIEKVDDDWRHPSDKCDRSDFPDAILAALAEAGLVVVPRKPTEKMMQAALRYVDDDTQDALPHGVWQVMIEVANEQ